MEREFITNPIYQDYKDLWDKVDEDFDVLREHSDPEIRKLAKKLEEKLMDIDLFLKNIVVSFWKEAPFHESWAGITPKPTKCSGTGSVAP